MLHSLCSYVCRLHERQASRVSVTVRDSPSATCTSVDASNLLIGHGLLLRAAALAQALTEDAAEQQQQQRSEAAAPAAAAAESASLDRSASAASLDAGPSPEQEQLSPSAEQLAEGASAPEQQQQPEDAGSVEPAPPAAASPAANSTATSAAQSPRTPATPVSPAAPERAAQPAAPPPPGKPALVSVHVADCRLVLRYQPALHPAGGSGSQHGVGGSGIPAATHDFLSVHQDLLAMDVPLLRLQLPLDPAALAQAAAAAGEDAAGGSSAGGSPLPGGSPRYSSARGCWRELSVAALDAGAGRSSGASQQPPPALHKQQQQQVLVEAGRLALSAATVGYTRHTMLPLLQLPSLRLTADLEHRDGAAAAAAAGGGWAAAAAGPAASAAVRYQLHVAALDLGLHPSQLSMLTSAAQICEHELALLLREPAEPPGTDSESAVTSLSGLTLERPASQPAAAPAEQQQKQRQWEPPSPAQAAAGSPAPAGAAGSSSAASEGSQRAASSSGGTSPGTSPGGGHDLAAAPCPAASQWRLEVAVDSVGLSILGSTASSSCLKLEWRELQAVYADGGGLLSSAREGLLASASRASLRRARSSRASSWRGTAGAGEAASEQCHELQLSWRLLAVYALQPRLTHPSLSPFAFAGGMAGLNGHSG